MRRATLTDGERDALQALVDDVLSSLVASHLMRQVIVEGLKCSSACIVVGLVNGLPCVELIPSKWCTPTLRRDGTVECVVVQYKHPREDDPKKWDCCSLYTSYAADEQSGVKLGSAFIV